MLNPNSRPSSLPWERARERATSRKACIWTVEVLGKVATIRGMPSPQPSPTGEGAGCSGFRRYRSSENARNINSRNFSGSLYRKADGTNIASVFQTAFEPIGRVYAARHARGGLRLQGKWRTRACISHAPYMRAMACYACFGSNSEITKW